jgi:hypothetical protein
MWLTALAVVALVAGNWLRNSGVEEARANAFGSAASLAGRRKSGMGNWVNLIGGVCLVAGMCWLWL